MDRRSFFKTCGATAVAAGSGGVAFGGVVPGGGAAAWLVVQIVRLRPPRPAGALWLLSLEFSRGEDGTATVAARFEGIDGRLGWAMRNLDGGQLVACCALVGTWCRPSDIVGILRGRLVQQ